MYEQIDLTDEFSLPTGRRTVVDLLNTAIARPAFILSDIDMTNAMRLKDHLESQGHRITITAILLKAISTAQVDYPGSRTELLLWGKSVTYESIVGGFTVERELEEEKTVFFGEIEAPHNKSLPEIAKLLSHHARKPIEKIEPMALQKRFAKLPEFLRLMILNIGRQIPPMRLGCQKATFGLTTLGKYGISEILAPCICTSTFAIGTVEDRPVVVGDKIEARQMMTISYNFDQHAIDIPVAARFLHDVKTLLEGGMEEMKTVPTVPVSDSTDAAIVKTSQTNLDEAA